MLARRFLSQGRLEAELNARSHALIGALEAIFKDQNYPQLLNEVYRKRVLATIDAQIDSALFPLQTHLSNALRSPPFRNPTSVIERFGKKLGEAIEAAHVLSQLFIANYQQRYHEKHESRHWEIQKILITAIVSSICGAVIGATTTAYLNRRNTEATNPQQKSTRLKKQFTMPLRPT
ncbi:MAG: hypothetical protein ABI877_03020 [Gemmatimonadaceae bacterium]